MMKPHGERQVASAVHMYANRAAHNHSATPALKISIDKSVGDLGDMSSWPRRCKIDMERSIDTCTPQRQVDVIVETT